MPRWLETDTGSNVNISSATEIGSYTADADRLILPQVLIDQAAGGGDYLYWVTLQVNGSGSTYLFGPVTTDAVAASVTAIGAQGGLIAVRSGDAVKVYVDGLAGDTTTPDTIVRWFELAALRPTTADRTLDVSAGGEAGVDWSNVGSPTTTVNLSGTSTKANEAAPLDAAGTRTAMGLSAANLDSALGAISAKTTNLPASPAGVGDAMTLANDALTAAKLATDAVAEIATAIRAELATELARIDAAVSTRLATAGYTAPPAAGAVADAVLDEAMSGHTTPGTAGAALAAAGSAGDPWITDLTDGDYDDPDTAGYILARLADLDMSAVTQVAASSAGHLTITAGITFEESVTGLTIPADWVAAIWTLKANVRDADTAALAQLRETNPAAGGDGLQRVNGAAPAAPITADDGELTVNQAGGSITIYLTDELSALLAAAVDLGWDVKFIDGGGDSTGQRGTADVVLTETRATT